MEIADFLLEVSPETGYDFLTRLEETISDLGKNPRIGSPQEANDPEIQGLRVWPVKSFRRYLIFYLIRLDTLDILRIVDSRRDFSLLFHTD
ncbi:MAG: type II toxin-antitoxin system RelE/ParE family toxin [Acidobacteria bacterium]|nr:MAG: type II toxin-antitoxin system RelE/ParE family toxin [Acidobacteriota bacterium]REK03112.1 MAG: type II toxin-antitoxin system RelE/ParE family toxin [Acidobacteriota bacterium]REK15460.1 MAG: type II toxin-antitoxin system RelE/ParE family toxin [Acidobacteriota bacterium]REK45810.1 MAG: type II toxin-antitoxin system RelE/ParE family toxin [Acidobacteriota bacterium]